MGTYLNRIGPIVSATTRMKEDLQAVIRHSEDMLEAMASETTARLRQTGARLREALNQAQESCRQLEGASDSKHLVKKTGITKGTEIKRAEVS